MRWAGRLGRIFALGWLILLWPVASAFGHGRLGPPRTGALLVALTVYVGTYAYFCFRGYRNRGPWVVAVQAVALSLLALAINALSGVRTPNPFVVPIMVAGFGLRPRPAAVAVAALTGVALADTFTVAGFSAQVVVLEVLFLAPQMLLWGAGAIGLRYLLDVLAQLQSAREQIARLAVEQERARISRDLHDLLGHSLSLMTLEGELAARLVPAGAPGGAEVRDLVRLAREALREVREAVTGYRQPTLATELTAARTALEAAGIGCDIEQSVGAVTRETEAVLGWAIREGVTNVIRHSGAAHCSIVLAREDGMVRADVVDDGVGCDGTARGTGLSGLGERVAAICGRLEADRGAARGFRLSVAAPADGSAQAAEP